MSDDIFKINGGGGSTARLVNDSGFDDAINLIIISNIDLAIVLTINSKNKRNGRSTRDNKTNVTVR